MKIVLANPRGFCAGVNMAIECLDEAIRIFGPEIYVYHEIVHNKYVVDRFTRQGVTFVDAVDDVPEEAILLYSAHGVSPEIREQAVARRLHTIDATCPLVTKVHMEAVRYARQGYHIVLIGHDGHDEVIGTMGEAPQSITLVETPEEVDHLEFPHLAAQASRLPDEGDRTDADEAAAPHQSGAKIAYLTQTTLSVQEAGRVIERLKQRFPHIESPPKEDICYATTNRQEAVETMARAADVVIVLGSQNSSNSQRLAEIGRSSGTPAYLIDGAHELQPEWFADCSLVLVTAGASAPEVVVEECIDWLVQRYGAAVEQATIREEHVSFPLPRELRALQAKV